MHVKVLTKLYNFLCDEHGATVVESSIMIVLIILVAYVAVGFLG